ncbi:bifunctional diaminohydroxyphosphoribosylaminopyrimidine deaminase/5-amino-6-(5-phosphoribosylamino)uracil reductase RibD [Candidatus Kapabacteria bacterium]|nr:bifunctional diaminohydroxyphosphoribosylaminopyrimidine deaminase/5-amino-6-(5-phosphoribosylamino)uracil reductase RibD [Candidatus Kapabacteria bacterium]
MSDNYFISRCLELAKKGLGKVSPNPLVGAVIVSDGKIISESYHKQFGGFHAERNAILSLGDTYDFSNCHIYCNLEPCTHFGKTPPCTDLIIEKNFKRVVFGSLDPNPLVSGKSVAKFKNSGIKVDFGFNINECKFTNRFFLKSISKQIPWVIAKYAISKDGYMSSGNNIQESITGLDAHKDVHQTRSLIDAILIGKNTALIDNPNLNVRYVEGRNPKKIVIDKDLSLPLSLNIFQSNPSLTYIACFSDANPKNKNYLSELGVNIIEFEPNKSSCIPLALLLQKLYSLKIISLIVEGGANLLNQFFELDLVDEVQSYQSLKLLHSGLKPTSKKLDNAFTIHESIQLGMDTKQVFINNSSFSQL